MTNVSRRSMLKAATAATALAAPAVIAPTTQLQADPGSVSHDRGGA